MIFQQAGRQHAKSWLLDCPIVNASVDASLVSPLKRILVTVFPRRYFVAICWELNKLFIWQVYCKTRDLSEIFAADLGSHPLEW